MQNHFSRASLNHVGNGERRGCGKGVHVRARVHVRERLRELGWTFVTTGNIENDSTKQHKKFVRWLLPPFDTCFPFPFFFSCFPFCLFNLLIIIIIIITTCFFRSSNSITSINLVGVLVWLCFQGFRVIFLEKIGWWRGCEGQNIVNCSLM